MSQGEKDYGTLQELEHKINKFERAPARERADGLTITEEEARVIKPLVERGREDERRYRKWETT